MYYFFHLLNLNNWLKGRISLVVGYNAVASKVDQEMIKKHELLSLLANMDMSQNTHL